jgi:hypothetical protein
MKNYIFLVVSLIVFSACSKDDNDSTATTNSVITLTDTNNAAVSGVTVYAYGETTWQVLGDNALFADFQATSNSEGKVTFSNLDSETNFNTINNNQNNFRFSAHYLKNGVNKKKVISITFNKGDSKTGTILLD